MTEKNRKVCVFLPNWLGDAVMATPAIRCLHEYFGNDAVFTALARPPILELFEGNPWFDHQIPFKTKNLFSKQSQLSLIQQIRQENFDLAVLFSDSLRTALIAWFGRAKQRIGYSRSGRSLFLSSSFRMPPQEIPLVDYYLNLTNLLIENKPDFSADRYRLELYTSPEEEKLGDTIWSNLGLRSPEKVLVLNVGAAGSVVRHWPADYAVELCRLVVDQLGFDVLINCGPDEIGMARKIVADSKRDRVFSLAEQPMNIHSGKICLKRARLTVSTDSGPAHIAAAFGKPTIVLLGPTSERYIANPSLDRMIINQSLPCSPCYARKKCPQKHRRCMKDLTPQIVFEKIREKLNS